MPTDTIVVVGLICVAFATFMATLYWASRHAP
jgi:hypothetical protein